MANFIIRYRVTETTLQGAGKKKYITNLLVPAVTIDEAKQIIEDSYVNTEDITYEINFL